MDEMIDLLRDMTKTAQETGERAFRLFFDVLALASERLRTLNAPPAGAPGNGHATSFATPAPAAPVPGPTPTPPAAVPPAEEAAPATGELDDARLRNDQLIRVLDLLTLAADRWVSAKELSDAGDSAGMPILPGNVRKVIRARGGEYIETRPREGSRRGAMEYRITEVGREHLAAAKRA
jgi:hypothetical protein